MLYPAQREWDKDVDAINRVERSFGQLRERVANENFSVATEDER